MIPRHKTADTRVHKKKCCVYPKVWQEFDAMIKYYFNTFDRCHQKFLSWFCVLGYELNFHHHTNLDSFEFWVVAKILRAQPRLFWFQSRFSGKPRKKSKNRFMWHNRETRETFHVDYFHQNEFDLCARIVNICTPLSSNFSTVECWINCVRVLMMKIGNYRQKSERSQRSQKLHLKLTTLVKFVFWVNNGNLQVSYQKFIISFCSVSLCWSTFHTS